MNEQEHLEAIRSSLPEHGFVSPSHVDTVEEALRLYPHSTRLWCFRGDLIQLCDEERDNRELVEAQQSYERALEIDPECIEAVESLAHFFEAVKDEPELVHFYFQRAATLRSEGGKLATCE